ncbi:MAG: DNA alkylation repair protein, partial [Phycisphaerales bacterium]
KAVLTRLNRGEEPTITLSEWLAVDLAVLAERVLSSRGHAELAKSARAVAAKLSKDGGGVMERHRAIAAHLHAQSPDARARADLIEYFASHVSEIPRQWAAFMVAVDAPLEIVARMEVVRPYAADGHMGVREIAWMVLRPGVAADVPGAIGALREWATHPDANVRRCAIEATRPRGVWCSHIAELKAEPWAAESLLSCVMADGSRYVQNSAANWLNDASKTKAGAAWVKRFTRDALKRSDGPETAYIVKRALRTVKKGE